MTTTTVEAMDSSDESFLVRLGRNKYVTAILAFIIVLFFYPYTRYGLTAIEYGGLFGKLFGHFVFKLILALLIGRISMFRFFSTPNMIMLLFIWSQFATPSMWFKEQNARVDEFMPAVEQVMKKYQNPFEDFARQKEVYYAAITEKLNGTELTTKEGVRRAREILHAYSEELNSRQKLNVKYSSEVVAEVRKLEKTDPELAEALLTAHQQSRRMTDRIFDLEFASLNTCKAYVNFMNSIQNKVTRIGNHIKFSNQVDHSKYIEFINKLEHIDSEENMIMDKLNKQGEA